MQTYFSRDAGQLIMSSNGSNFCWPSSMPQAKSISIHGTARLHLCNIFVQVEWYGSGITSVDNADTDDTCMTNNAENINFNDKQEAVQDSGHPPKATQLAPGTIRLCLYTAMLNISIKIPASASWITTKSNQLLLSHILLSKNFIKIYKHSRDVWKCIFSVTLKDCKVSMMFDEINYEATTFRIFHAKIMNSVGQVIEVKIADFFVTVCSFYKF